MVVPGRGFLLNNQLTDFQDLGFEPGTGIPYANGPEGGKRLRRTAVGVDAETLGGECAPGRQRREERETATTAPTRTFTRARTHAESLSAVGTELCVCAAVVA